MTMAKAIRAKKRCHVALALVVSSSEMHAVMPLVYWTDTHGRGKRFQEACLRREERARSNTTDREEVATAPPLRTPSRARHRLHCDQVRRRQRRRGSAAGGWHRRPKRRGRQQRCIGWRGENQDGTAPSMPPPQEEDNEEEEQQEQGEKQKQKPPARAPPRCPPHLTLTAIVIIIMRQTVNDE